MVLLSLRSFQENATKRYFGVRAVYARAACELLYKAREYWLPASFLHHIPGYLKRLSIGRQALLCTATPLAASLTSAYVQEPMGK